LLTRARASASRDSKSSILRLTASIPR
jgi:hypothetical protein